MSAQPIDAGPGPTLQSQTKAGYQLANRHVRVVIHPTTGDVVAFGPVDGQSVLATTVALSTLPSQSFGHVEARDEQTWQFITDTPDGLIWRKIYCLNGDHLLVSLIAQNATGRPINGVIELHGVAPNLIAHDAEHAASPRFRIHGFNVDHDLPKPASDVLVHSDPFVFAADERHAFTTDWELVADE